LAVLRVRADLSTAAPEGQRHQPKLPIFPPPHQHGTTQSNKKQPPSANEGVRVSRKSAAQGQLDPASRLYLGNSANSNQKNIVVSTGFLAAQDWHPYLLRLQS
jgi:hypothetical protein